MTLFVYFTMRRALHSPFFIINNRCVMIVTTFTAIDTEGNNPNYNFHMAKVYKTEEEHIIENLIFALKNITVSIPEVKYLDLETKLVKLYNSDTEKFLKKLRKLINQIFRNEYGKSSELKNIEDEMNQKLKELK